MNILEINDPRLSERYGYLPDLEQYGHFSRTSPTKWSDDCVGVVELPNTSGPDRFGHEKAVNIANHRYIASFVESLEGDGEEPALAKVSYHSFDMWAVRTDRDMSEAEQDLVNSLLDHPALDEGGISVVEQEWDDAYWSDTAAWDIAFDIEDAHGSDVKPHLPALREFACRSEIHPEGYEGYPIYSRSEWPRVVAHARTLLGATTS